MYDDIIIFIIKITILMLSCQTDFRNSRYWIWAFRKKELFHR